MSGYDLLNKLREPIQREIDKHGQSLSFTNPDDRIDAMTNTELVIAIGEALSEFTP